MSPATESVTAVLRAAYEAVIAADLPPELNPMAFEKALQMVAGESADSVDGSGTPSSENAGAGGSPIAKEFDINSDQVDRLFDEVDGALQFVGNLEKLGSTKQAKVEGLAVLLIAARSAAGYDPDGRTADRVIRAEVERHGLYDKTNYNKHLRRLRSYANPNGTGKDATYKIKYEGRQRARELAKDLISE